MFDPDYCAKYIYKINLHVFWPYKRLFILLVLIVFVYMIYIYEINKYNIFKNIEYIMTKNVLLFYVINVNQ